jgi:choline dehydrogenase-like flavoprotein
MKPCTGAETRLALWLDRVALAAALLALLGLAAAVARPGALAAPWPLLGPSVTGLALLALVARVAGGDVRRFRALTRLVVVGLAMAGTVLLLLGLVPGGSAGWVPLLGALVAYALAGAVGLAERSSGREPAFLPWTTDKGPTAWERAGAAVCVLLAALVALGTARLALAALQSPPLGPASRLAYGGALFGGGLVALCLVVAALRIRPLDQLLALVTAALALGVVAQLLNGPAGAGGGTWGAALAASVAVLGVLLVLKNRISHALLDDLAYFAPLDFRAFEALAESLFEQGASARVPPHRIALRVDSYLGSFRSSRAGLARWCVRLWEFLPLLWLRPSLSLLAPEARRRFVERNFVRDGGQQRPLYRILHALGLGVVAAGLDTALRFAMQLTYMGYYGDPLVQRDLGYVPFSEREKSFPVVPTRPYRPLRVETPEEQRVRGLEVLPSADVVVIGTGAAGAILAERLAEQGRDVLLLDRGLHVPPDSFSEDEIAMLSRLYGDGGLQMAESFAFNIVQGSCVGGTTVVNNAVCFELPEDVLERWNDRRGADARLDRASYRAAEAAVKERLRVRSIRDSSVTRPWPEVLNQGDHVVEAGVKRLLADVPHEYDVVRANIVDCLGCGLCNFGCKYGRKLSMLDEVLPRAQQRHPDRFRIFSETEVVALRSSGGRVTEIVARVAGRRTLTIRRPTTVVVSAGAVASSWLLLRSGLGDGLPVGRGVGGNIATPLHGLFDQELFSFHGLQIAHYLRLPDRPGFVVESEFNPPISQALLMPGWLDTHERNMRRYRRMTMFGVVVGSEPVGRVNPRGQLGMGGPSVVFEPTERDLDRLVEGMTLLGRAMLAGGAREVLPSTRSYRSYASPAARYRSEADLAHLERLVKVDRDVVLGTPHPQGGNAIGARRGRDGSGGVVDPGFRVHGYENLYVCDASVFPSPVTVNPQLTVMALAHYAADLIR